MYNADVKAIFLCIRRCALRAGRGSARRRDRDRHVARSRVHQNAERRPEAPDHIAGARVVAAYKGGSKDMQESISRVDGFAEEMQDASTAWRSCPTSPTLLSKVDVVLLESLDGRVHLEQARPVIAAHKPLFIDKPLAATLEDAREIARLAKAAGVPWFSSSSLRFGAIGAATKLPGLDGGDDMGSGTVRGAPSAGTGLVRDSSGGIAVHHHGDGVRERDAHRGRRMRT